MATELRRPVPRTVVADEEINLDPLRPYWHPVAEADDVTDAPVCVQVLDEQVVLFRSEGSVRAFKDLCPHRGAKISMGAVFDGTIMCPYHGFRYDGSGRCVYIPSQPKDLQHIPSRLQLIPYDCTERYGLVWVALEEPVAPIAAYPEFDDPSFKAFRGFARTWEASAARFLENALDISHFPFVHPGKLGDPERPEIEPFEITPTETGFTYEFDWIPPGADHLGETVHYVYDYTFPFTVRLDIQSAAGSTILFTPTLPIASRRCSMWVMFARNHSFDRPDGDWVAFSEAIWAEDQAVTEQQHPEMLPVDLSEEIHLRVADAPGIALRRLLREIGLAYA
jgi:phenylpropionate dioxygenase-like ring-hydroxylating dioxygenase large terminal subunit